MFENLIQPLIGVDCDCDVQTSIAAIFANGEYGAWYDLSNLSTLSQDSAGTTAVSSDGDPIGRVEDLSGNAAHLTQSTSAARPIYDSASNTAFFDAVDDKLTATLSQPIVGTMLMAIGNAIIHADIDVSTAFDVNYTPAFPTADNLRGLVVIDRTLTSAEIAYFESVMGGNNNFTGILEIFALFRGRADITRIHSGDWDLSQNTSLNGVFREMPNLISVDTSHWDTGSASTCYACFAYLPLITTLDLRSWVTSSCNSFGWFARGCTSLTKVLINGGSGNPFADSPCTNYTNAFIDTNLTPQSIDDILVAIESAGTSNGTFDQSGGSAPSATGNSAIDALRVRGWTIEVTGGY